MKEFVKKPASVHFRLFSYRISDHAALWGRRCANRQRPSYSGPVHGSF